MSSTLVTRCGRVPVGREQGATDLVRETPYGVGAVKANFFPISMTIKAPCEYRQALYLLLHEVNNVGVGRKLLVSPLNYLHTAHCALHRLPSLKAWPLFLPARWDSWSVMRRYKHILPALSGLEQCFADPITSTEYESRRLAL